MGEVHDQELFVRLGQWLCQQAAADRVDLFLEQAETESSQQVFRWIAHYDRSQNVSAILDASRHVFGLADPLVKALAECVVGKIRLEKWSTAFDYLQSPQRLVKQLLDSPRLRAVYHEIVEPHTDIHQELVALFQSYDSMPPGSVQRLQIMLTDLDHWPLRWSDADVWRPVFERLGQALLDVIPLPPTLSKLGVGRVFETSGFIVPYLAAGVWHNAFKYEAFHDWLAQFRELYLLDFRNALFVHQLEAQLLQRTLSAHKERRVIVVVVGRKHLAGMLSLIAHSKFH